MGKRDAFPAPGGPRPFIGLVANALTAWALTSAGFSSVLHSQERFSAQARPAEQRRMTLSWCDHYTLLPQGFDSMTREVGAVFEDIGIALTWRRSSDAEPAPGDLHVIVALMPNDASAWGAPKRITGLTFVNETSRAVYIFLPKLFDALGWTRSPKRTLSARQTVELARALGRTLAHELVHAIAPHAPHTESGLMCAWLNRRDLLHGRLRMSDSTAEHVLAGLDLAHRTQAKRHVP